VALRKGLPIGHRGGPAMRLPRPRLTIRLMMALVAVAALALTVEATRRRMAEAFHVVGGPGR
jgi:hypothetical protein